MKSKKLTKRNGKWYYRLSPTKWPNPPSKFSYPFIQHIKDLWTANLSMSPIEPGLDTWLKEGFPNFIIRLSQNKYKLIFFKGEQDVTS